MARCSTITRVAGLAATTLSSAAWAQSNNLCANATPLPLGGNVIGFTSIGFADGSASCGDSSNSPDSWHTVVVPCGGDLTVYTCPASYDTVISLHSGCPGTTSNQIACNDDSAYCGTAYPHASAFTVAVLPGTYIVRVSGYLGAYGSYTLNSVLAASPPPNDHGAHATHIGDGTIDGCTSAATVDGSATCGSSSTTPDVWYTYTAACNGTLDLYTCPASFDTVISVHSAFPGSSGNELACNDDSAYCGTAYPRTSYVPLPVTAGSSYLIRVSGYNGSTGAFTLNAHLNGSAPTNETCASATPIGNGAVTGSTACAVSDGGGDCVISSPGPDVWYRYTPTCHGTAHIFTCPASFDTILSVYTGCGGTQIACNDDSEYCGTAYPRTSHVSFPVMAGAPYLIRVYGFSGASGTFVLNTSNTCCYPNCDGSTSPPILNVGDFICFLNRFAAADPYANCDGSTVAPTLNVQDFGCFINRFGAGCP